MAENMGKWPSGHGQLTKIRLSEGDGGETVTPAAQFGPDCHGFEGYLGNVGSMLSHGNLSGLAKSGILGYTVSGRLFRIFTTSIHRQAREA